MVDIEKSGYSEKPRHFTYDSPHGHLQQGDILLRKSLLGHPEAKNLNTIPDDSQYLVVLTQSCDLEPRRKSPKADFIALAPTKSVSVILDEMLKTIQNGGLAQAANVCAKNKKDRVVDFLNRLMNNN